MQKKIAKKTVLSLKDEVLKKTSEFHYDEFGNEIKQINFSSDDEIVSTIVKTYDKNRIMLSMEINETGQVKTKWEYENSFNESQHLQKSIARQLNATTIETYHYNMDNSYEVTTVTNDKTISIKQYSSNKELIKIINPINNSQTSLTYDSHHNLTEHKEMLLNRPNRIITYKNEYNSKNQLSSISSGNIITQFHYNENGDVTEEIHKTMNGVITLTVHYHYEYQ
ncbi:MAG: hypothetical protein ABI576_05230 [Flavobacterium sp.]